MKPYKDVPCRNKPGTKDSAPPDKPGWWWVVADVDQPPRLLYLEEIPILKMQKGWDPNKGMCWPLSDLQDNPRFEELLTALVSKPDLLMDVAEAIWYMRIVRLWVEEKPDCHARRSVSGITQVLIQRAPADAVLPWKGTYSGGKESFYATLADAKKAADHFLADVGYVFLDPVKP